MSRAVHRFWLAAIFVLWAITNMAESEEIIDVATDVNGESAETAPRRRCLPCEGLTEPLPHEEVLEVCSYHVCMTWVKTLLLETCTTAMLGAGC